MVLLVQLDAERSAVTLFTTCVTVFNRARADQSGPERTTGGAVLWLHNGGVQQTEQLADERPGDGESNFEASKS